MNRALVPVLMYHAVSQPPGPVEEADEHYCVTRGRFSAHLTTIRARGRVPSSVSRVLEGQVRDPVVGVTFDDGHESNAWAAGDLLSHGGSADFFVNPSTVGRGRHLSWGALRDMAAEGMSIQSHGQHHRYLDELAPSEVEQELRQSKWEIEDRLGLAVTLFAPPGGRMSRDLLETAVRLGYRAVCSSRVGLWRRGREQGVEIPRLAVLHSTTERQVDRWITQGGWELRAMELRYQVLSAAKRALGNSRYERLRRAALAVRGRL